MSTKCKICRDGVVDTGNNKLPCDCPKGSSALFNVAGVDGLVAGAETRRHLFNGSPEPLRLTSPDILASSLPGRNEDIKSLEDKLRWLLNFLGLLELVGEKDKESNIKNLYESLHNLHVLTSKMLGK